jgi:hypothetical protein
MVSYLIIISTVPTFNKRHFRKNGYDLANKKVLDGTIFNKSLTKKRVFDVRKLLSAVNISQFILPLAFC